MCLRPDDATIERIRAKFQALIVPYYLARLSRSRGKKHGETQWQQDHWKAMDVRRGAKKHNKDTITIRWQQDEKYRNSQQADGQKNIADTWTTSRRSTSLTPHLGITGTSTRTPSRWHATKRDRQAGLMKARTVLRPTTTNSRKSSTRTWATQFLDSEERENKAKTIRRRIARQIRMDESKLEHWFLATFFLFFLFTNVVATRTWMNIKTLNGVDTKTPMTRLPIARSSLEWCFSSQQEMLRDTNQQDHQWRDLKWWIRRFFKDFRLEGGGGPFHRTVLAVSDNFSSFCTSPPQTTPTSRPLTGIRSTPCATSPEGRQSGHLAEPLPHTGYEPKTCIDVSSEHTPINYPSRRNSFNIENNDLTTTVAASENSDGFHQQAAASGSPQQVPASVVNPWLGADMWSRTGKLVRGDASSASVEGTLSRGKRDRDLESVQTLSERQNLHVYLEQKAELSVQGECAARRRLSETEADMVIRNRETNRELESRRLELYQAIPSAEKR